MKHQNLLKICLVCIDEPIVVEICIILIFIKNSINETQFYETHNQILFC